MNKKFLIYLIHRAANLKMDTEDVSIALDNQSLVLLTAAGQITGTPLEKDTLKSEAIKEQVLDTLFLESGNVYSSEYNEDDFILLKNVTLITSSGNQLSYGYLYVFTDDIIAASFGSLQAN